MQSAKIKLNTIQQLMLRWSRDIPYNAVHILKLSGKADLSRWNRSILKKLVELKLGCPKFFRSNSSVRFTHIENIEIETPNVALEEYVNTEVNRLFASDDLPLRFFCIQNNDSSYYLGVIYDHWIGDSYAMRTLMQHIFLHYQNHKTNLPTLTLQAPKFSTLYRQHLGRFTPLRAITESLRNQRHLASAYRLRLSNPADFRNRLLFRTLTEGLIEKLHLVAKQHQVTVHDVFLTTAAKTLGEFSAQARQKVIPKKSGKLRNQLAVGTITDIRHAANKDLKHVFGSYMGNYTIVVDQPENKTFYELLKNISTDTSKIKQCFIAIKNNLALSAALFLSKYTKMKTMQMLYKSAPIIAGISNVNLTHEWTDKTVLDYLRISPTGPMTPLVFALTTLGKRLSLCVTYRTTAFNEHSANLICETFVKNLTEITVYEKNSSLN